MRIPDEIEVDGEMVKLPKKWEICAECRGECKSSAYLGAITSSDRQPGGDWDDPDDFEDYMNGAYDKPCEACNATGKVRVVDWEQLRPNVKAAYRAWLAEELEYQAMCAAERRMGA